jgi:hypothetical protein
VGAGLPVKSPKILEKVPRPREAAWILVVYVVDDVTRQSLAAETDTSISGSQVVRELAELIRQRG